MTLDVDIGHRLGDFTLEARFTAADGVTALFGRSGAGKTTLINTIAGLIQPARGRIAVDGHVLFDAASGVAVPAHKRRIGYVFQEGRLFPHLTVRQNLLYGNWFTPQADRYVKLEPIVALLGLGPMLGRRPMTLSGGEKQRVAIGRALLASPRLLLMDEPLASLDAARKEEIFPYIERLRDEIRIPIVYVSHSVPEVARLATTVVVMEGGRVDTIGPVASILGQDVAIEARVVGHDRDTTTLQVPRLDLPAGAAVNVQIGGRNGNGANF